MRSIEQQIYASLAIPGLKAGHHTHAATGGLDAATLERHEEICNRWGQYQAQAEFSRSLVHLPQWIEARPPAPPSHHLIIFITDQGRDAGGRPGAMLRHIVRLDHESYRSFACHPFHLLRDGLLLSSWDPDTPLPDIGARTDDTRSQDFQAIFPERYPLLRALLQRFLADGRLHLPTRSDSPAVEETISQLLELIPVEQRARLSLTSFAYSNPRDYVLAAVREPDESFRGALAALEQAPPAALPAGPASYLESLFNALTLNDYSRANDLVHGTPPGSAGGTAAEAGEPGLAEPLQSPLPEAESERREKAPDRSHQADVGPGAASERAAASGRGLEELSTSAVASDSGELGDEDEFRPSFRRRKQKPAPSRGRRLLMTLVLFVLVASGALLLRDRLGGHDQGSSIRQASKLSADNLAELVQRHEQLLAGMLSAGARDYDLREAMREALTSLPEQLRQAMRRQSEELQAQCRLSLAAASTEPFAVLAETLSARAQVIELQARRVSRLEELLQVADPAVLRASYDAQTKAFDLSDSSRTGPFAAGAQWEQWAPALRRAATSCAGFQTALGRPAQEGGWTELAAGLDSTLLAFPPTAPPPSPVVAVARTASQLHELLTTLTEADFARWPRRFDYRWSDLRRGKVADALASMAVALDAMEKEEGSLEPSLTSLRTFSRLAIEQPATGSSAEAAETFLRQAAALCPPQSPLPLVCGDEAFTQNLERWKLHAWRGLGAPGSARGGALLEELGPVSLPGGGGPAEMEAMIELGGRLETAPLPAAPTLVRETQQVRRNLATPLYRAMLGSWLSIQQRGSAEQRQGFSAAYEGMRSARQRLDRSQGRTASQAFADLRRSITELRGLDLRQAEASADQKAQVNAARALLRRWAEPVDLPLRSCRVELLGTRDYDGISHQVTRLRVSIDRVQGSSATPVLSVTSPPLLSTPGAGFEPVELEIPEGLTVAATDHLLVRGSDVESGHLWFYFYADPPNQGHVLERLANAHEVRITSELARRATEQNGLPPRGEDDGELVARIAFDLDPGWWRSYARALPELPE